MKRNAGICYGGPENGKSYYSDSDYFYVDMYDNIPPIGSKDGNKDIKLKVTTYRKKYFVGGGCSLYYWVWEWDGE